MEASSHRKRFGDFENREASKDHGLAVSAFLVLHSRVRIKRREGRSA
jgi:hypothetical protein